MRYLSKLLGSVIIALTASGCTSNISTVSLEQYSLLSDTSSAVLNDEYQVKVKLYGIIDSSGIVIRTSDVTYRPALHHVWGGKLEDELAVLIKEAMLEHHVDQALQVNCEVMRFNGALDGSVEIDALFKVSDGKKTIWSRSFSFTSIQKASGYPDLVSELKRGWRKICSEAVDLM